MRWKTGPKVTIDRLQKIRRKVERETTGVTGTVARSLDSALRAHVFPVARVSKQDATTGRDERQGRNKTGLVGVSWSTSGDGIKIRATVTGHYTGARTPAIVGVMRSLGRQKELRRTGLLVVPGPKGMRARDKISRGKKAHFVSFGRSSRLAIWSERQSKGLQALRHVILLDKQILDALVMSPTLRAKRKSIIDAWKRGVKQGFL